MPESPACRFCLVFVSQRSAPFSKPIKDRPQIKMVAADHLEKAVNGTTTGEARHDEKANGSGKAKPFPPSSQWTSKVPVDTQVYGKKTVDCSDGAAHSNRNEKQNF